MKRTGYCGHVTEKDIEKNVVVMGWVQNKRDMGGIIFIDLRDREGILQVVFDARNLSSDQFEVAERLRSESVISVQGLIRLRDEETYNPSIITGTVELAAKELELLSEAESLPFQINDGKTIREDLRLKYRFLDLRRPEMQSNIRFRAKLQRSASDFLEDLGFIPVETPMLTKSTPEGARDYLVPSRVHPGQFYALPQSPQIFKQLLMVGGLDKYYQIARCFRDEDLRSDRQPEFTQVDIEMSFVTEEDVLEMLEEMFVHLMKSTKNIDVARPFQRLRWQDCMDVYGNDKPDLRFDLPIVDLSNELSESKFSVFKKVINSGGYVRAINAKGGAVFTRNMIEQLTEKAISFGAEGMAWIQMQDDGTPYSILTKFMDEAEIDSIVAKTEAKAGDFILFSAGGLDEVRHILGALRTEVAQLLGLADENVYKFLIVTDFPQFEFSKGENRFVAMHHPFTMPVEDDIALLSTDPLKVRAQAYDVVLNGVELGSGSVRIHKSDVQQKMFETLGFSKKEIDERFGFMVDAFKYGTPPHAGFAFGLDRLAMLLLGAESLRDVIVFPKTKDGSCLLTNAPSFVDDEQLEALALVGLGNLHDNKAKGVTSVKALNVSELAKGAKLSLDRPTADRYKRELDEMVLFIDNVINAKVSSDKMDIYGREIFNVLRSDEVSESTPAEILFQGAKVVKENCIVVPQVIE